MFELSYHHDIHDIIQSHDIVQRKLSRYEQRTTVGYGAIIKYFHSITVVLHKNTGKKKGETLPEFLFFAPIRLLPSESVIHSLLYERVITSLSTIYMIMGHLLYSGVLLLILLRTKSTTVRQVLGLADLSSASATSRLIGTPGPGIPVSFDGPV